MRAEECFAKALVITTRISVHDWSIRMRNARGRRDMTLHNECVLHVTTVADVHSASLLST